MKYRLEVRGKAERDLEEAARWYEEQQAGLAMRFEAAVDEAISDAVDAPLSFRILSNRPEIRRVLLDEFPYRIVYTIVGDTVVIIRILHSARSDSHWKREKF